MSNWNLNIEKPYWRDIQQESTSISIKKSHTLYYITTWISSRDTTEKQQDINDELLSSHGQLRYPFNSQFFGGIFEVKPCHIRRL